MSDSDKVTLEQAASRVKAVAGAGGISSAQLADGVKAMVSYSTFYDRIVKVVSANNMSYDNSVEILAIVAPLCNKLTPEGAKKLLHKIVDIYVEKEGL